MSIAPTGSWAVLRVREEGQQRLPVLVWTFAGAWTIASTAAAGGGLGVRNWIINAHVHKNYDRRDIDRHTAEIADALQLAGCGVGMFTAADVTRVCHADCGCVSVDATVGLTRLIWAAQRSRSIAPVLATAPGTINIVGRLPVRFRDAALLNALCTATEAKAQALVDLGVAGTGTASDAITLACPAAGPSEAFGGPRARWGQPLAQAVYEAVSTGAQNWIVQSASRP